MGALSAPADFAETRWELAAAPSKERQIRLGWMFRSVGDMVQYLSMVLLRWVLMIL